MTLHTGRHFLQIPGPTNVPDRVLRAMDMPTLGHRGPEFAVLRYAVLAGVQRIFRTTQPVIIYPSSGTGAWEAAIVNTLAPGDKVLMAETGQFAVLWRGGAEKIKLDARLGPGGWGRRVGTASVAGHRRQVQARRRLRPGRLAARCRHRCDRATARGRQGACDQGRHGRAQRD